MLCRLFQVSLALAALALTAAPGLAQTKKAKGSYYSFHRGLVPPGPSRPDAYYGPGVGRSLGEDAEEIWRHYWWVIEDLCKKAGCNRVPFALGLAPIQGAEAVIHDGHREILYDGGEWGQEYQRRLFAIGHEVGHHVCRHTEAAVPHDQAGRWKEELEADQFAGMALQRYGSSLEDALAQARELFPETVEKGASHPPLAMRMAAITEGYTTSYSPCLTRLPSVAARPSGFWDHNGSMMLLKAHGAERWFYYQQPREGMQRVGVQEGTMLFEGKKTGDRYHGKARVFARHYCAPVEYDVRGHVSADQREVVMHGKAPLLDSECRTVGYKDDTLVFRLLSSQ